MFDREGLDLMRRIGTQNDILGECPVWSVAERALYWIDIRRPAIRRYDEATRLVETWAMPAMVGAIALCGGGRLVAALGDRVARFDPATGALDTLAHLSDLPPGHRFNDGRCDPAGRFWVSTMHNETRGPEGTLFRLGSGGLVPVLSELRIPNSLCWSPDGCTMYFADSLDYRIYAHSYDAETGRIGDRRVFATSMPPAFPDGSAVDAEGCIWNAEFNGGRVVRYDPNGRILRILDVPVPRPTCCAFGGPDLDILYVTTASQNMTEEERAAQPLAGALLGYDLGIRGLPEPLFRPPLAGDRA